MQPLQRSFLYLLVIYLFMGIRAFVQVKLLHCPVSTAKESANFVDMNL